MKELMHKYRLPALLIVLLTAVSFPLFLHLDYMPVRMWDESIMAVNAIEMIDNHNYLVTYFYGEPDVSNCKPPLMIWCITLFSKILGFSELSLRLPSAIGAFILCLALFAMLRKYTGSMVYAFMAVIVLVTSRGFIRNHVSRTGEYDSLLVLFATLFSLHLFLATEAEDRKAQSKHLFLFFIFLTLAVLTKGVACMMLAPGLFIYVVWRKRLLPFLQNPYTYAGLAIFLVVGIGYYVLREQYNPGYIQAVWEQELGGRYNTSLHGHRGAYTFYLNEIIEWQFTPYLVFFIPAVVAGIFFLKGRIARLIVFSGVVGSLFLLVVSSASTKLPHYDAPLFPFLAIITASFFYFVYVALNKVLHIYSSKVVPSAAAFAVTLLLLAAPYATIISHVYFPKGDWWEEGFSVQCRIFQDAAKGTVNIDSLKLVFPGKAEYGPKNVLTCYGRQLAEKGIQLNTIIINDVKAGDSLVVFDDWHKQLIEQNWNLKPVRYIERCHANVYYVEPQTPL
jgi:4-amino-4-deoxy-L-arabinose transferase-like glycosyltransferase